jgi:hypothetical protein
MRRALWSGCCALLLATVAGASDDASSGRRIFVTGGAADELIASFAGSNTRLAPRLRRCAGCHGRDGLGGREGGITMPPITWRALTAPREATSAQPGRPLYDDALLVRALGEGIDSAGRTLAPSMPRFQLTPAQASALLDHLPVDAVTNQARRSGATVLRRAHADSLAALLPPAPAASVDAIVVLSDVDFGRLAAGLADQPGSFLLAGAAEALAPEMATDERLRLVLPIGPGGAAASAVPPLASAAAAVLAEGLKRMGARVSRAGLITAIESLRDFPTGVLPPLNFDRGQHVGSHASIVIRPDRSRGMMTLGGWRTPR